MRIGGKERQEGRRERSLRTFTVEYVLPINGDYTYTAENTQLYLRPVVSHN